MGRAIVRDPQVFLFDEPLSNLDAKLRVQMRTEIRELHQRLTTTTVYVTHDQIEAMTMADKIVVMQNGYIEQIGTPLEVYDHPANIFVASFIGSPAMNMLDTVVRRDGAKAWADVEGARIDLPAKSDLKDGHKIMLGIRPEHLDAVGQGNERQGAGHRADRIGNPRRGADDGQGRDLDLSHKTSVQARSGHQPRARGRQYPHLRPGNRPTPVERGSQCSRE